MKITLENTGRRYNKEWIFRNVNHVFNANDHVAVLGSNGSGKSTFLQLVSGFLIPSEGKINYEDSSGKSIESIYKRITFASPALELFEDLTLNEIIRFHFQLKKPLPDFSFESFSEKLQLKGNENKQIKYFSSGMKQRVKLGLAILTETPVLFLDEPTSNLDRNGIEWYRQLMMENKDGRIIFVASNKVEDDYFFCHQTFEIEKFKPSFSAGMKF
jgi:ABC-type multidrug transport system ATPase subunit